MISQMALEDIKQIIDEGYELTPEDIITINAFALKYEQAKGKFAGFDFEMLHRTAIIDEGVYLREPTIGHEIWLKKISKYIDDDDYETYFAILVFALSKNSNDLPDADDIETVKKAVGLYCDLMKSYTKDLLYTALKYVMSGCKVTSYLKLNDNNEEDENGNPEYSDFEDWELCVGVGLIHLAQALQLGLTVADMKKMTREELNLIINTAFKFQGKDIKNNSDYELGRYYKTIDNIKNRLNKEKQ